MRIAVAGAGAFGTALAIALKAGGRDVALWGRQSAAMDALLETRVSPHLPGVTLPENLAVSANIDTVLAADVVLLAVPAQALDGFLGHYGAALAGKRLVACCKGIDVYSLQSPSMTIAAHVPDATIAALTGPSFAADIAGGLPTALTLACEDPDAGQQLQELLSTQSLRLYRTTDVLGAEFGGALKNVIAIACGIADGRGFGDNARAALVTRGLAELTRLCVAKGGRADLVAANEAEIRILEKYLPKVRHIEVQVAGDVAHNAIHLGIRDCSIQRRYQKVLEESPSIGLPEKLQNQIQTLFQFVENKVF